MNALWRLPQRLPGPTIPKPTSGAPGAVMALRAHCCRWPIGEVRSAAFRFCAAPCGDAIYCAEHERQARPKQSPDVREVAGRKF